MVDSGAKLAFRYYQCVTPMLRLCNPNIKRMLSTLMFTPSLALHINNNFAVV